MNAISTSVGDSRVQYRFLLTLISSAAFLTLASADELSTETLRAGLRTEAGLCLVIGDEARLACDLAASGSLQVHLLVGSVQAVEASLATVQQRGLGGRVVVQPLPADGHLPHPDRFINWIIIGHDAPVKHVELERVLAVRGSIYVGKSGLWQMKSAARKAGIDNWTHRFYDASGNCVSQDTVAATPRALQWQHGPALEDGTADGKVPRIADGRFVTFDSLTGDLLCRDASNGSLLWRKFIGSPPNADFAIVAGQIYLYFDEHARPGPEFKKTGERGPLVALDLATGQLTRTYAEALRAGDALPVPTQHHEYLDRFEKKNPVPWFVVREDVIVQAYGAELVVIERLSGKRRFSKKLDEAHTWFSPSLSGQVLLAAETVGTARRGRHDGATHVRAVTAFDIADGSLKWRNTETHPLRQVNDQNKGPHFLRAEFMPMSVANDLVLVHVSSYQFRHGGRFAVLQLKDGKELWHRDYQPKELYDQGSQRAILRGGEVIIMDGLGARKFDACTGEALGVPLALPKGSKRQARQNGACTSSRATVEWLICNAYLYVNRAGEIESCFGARGACGQGVVPANGLMYVNPTPCDCGDYTRGFVALAGRLPGRTIADKDRLARGPAFDEVKHWKLAVPKSDWPMFLANVERRSVVPNALPEKLTIRWQERAGKPMTDPLEADRRQSERYLGILSAPVAAAGLVITALPETHQVEARDAATGKLRWSFTTLGKVDSPPTVLTTPDAEKGHGIAIFGCADGAVYALRLSDGKLAWRFTAAPTDGLAMLHGHLASAMPLPGSVLVVDDTVLVSAGNHTDLGGLHCFALSAATGAIRSRRVFEADQPAVVANDILVADAHGTAWLGNGQSMLHLSTQLENVPIEATKTGAAANRPMMAFDRQGSRIRFRTDVGRGGSTHSWRGAMRTTFAAAHRIAADGDTTFALRDPTLMDRHPVRADQTPLITAGIGSEKKLLWATSVGALGSRESCSALIKAGDHLLLGGGARDGSTGFVQVLNARDGKLLATYALPSRVTECGLCVAGRSLIVCCEGGEILCFGNE